MDSLRLSLLWKRIASALDKQADGRTRPVRPWYEAEAPEGEEPQNLDAKDDSESEEDDMVELSDSESQAAGDESVESLAENEEAQPVSEEAPDMDIGGVQESLLLDPSEKARVVDLFQRWDPAFMAERHKETGVPSEQRGRGGDALGRPSQISHSFVLNEKGKLQNELADVDKRLDDARKAKFPPLAKIKNLEAERDNVIKRMDAFLKKYGPGAQEKDRQKDFESISEGMSGPEKRQVAPFEFDEELAKSPEQIEAERDAIEKANKEFSEAGGLAGQLLSKPGSDLSAEERGNLGVVLQGFRTLLSKPELKGSLEQERRLVQKIISTLRRLTDKFSETIRKDQALKRQVADVAAALENAIQSEESARQSSWHGNDPLRIAILSRLERAAGGRTQTLRDRHFGKKPIRTKGPNHPGSLPDLSTGISGFNPRTAFESMILNDSRARPEFDAAIKKAFDISYGQADGDIDDVFNAAAVSADGMLSAEYERIMDWGEKYPGTLTKEHIEFDPDNPEGRSPEPRHSGTMTDPETGNVIKLDDTRDAFVRDYMRFAHDVLDRMLETRQPPAEYFNDPELHGFQWNEETGEYELIPDRDRAESVPLSEDEKAARSKDVSDLREKESAPLTRDVLFREDGSVRDIKELIVSLSDERQAELRNVVEDEIDALEGKDSLSEDEKDMLGQLKDGLEQLGRAAGGRVKHRVQRLKS